LLKQAVILAGGRGTRLGDETRNTPKPMLQAGTWPFLEYLVRHLACYGLRDILLVSGHRGEVIHDYFGDGSRWGCRIRHARERELAGTGGFLQLFREKLDRRFLLLNGDTLFDFNYLDLAALHAERSPLCAIGLRRVADTARYGAVELDGVRVSGFAEKGRSGAGVINGGVYVLDRAAAEYVSAVPCSLEQEVLPRMVAAGQVVGRSYDGFFIDIGIPDTLADAQRSVPAWWRKPLAFLDRDGVINKDKGYVSSAERFEWVDGAPQAIRELNEAGYRVVVVTNQAGIARGYYDEAAFRRHMDWLQQALQPHGAHIDAVYFCPHHPSEGIGDYRADCNCRKPRPGLLEQALRDFPAAPERCFLIGDKESDLAAARAAGVTGYLFRETDNLAVAVGAIMRAACRANAAT
jgi:D-glycero-D-manno-heptose 1,7-bisphosphate phosphatase